MEVHGRFETTHDATNNTPATANDAQKPCFLRQQSTRPPVAIYRLSAAEPASPRHSCSGSRDIPERWPKRRTRLNYVGSLRTTPSAARSISGFVQIGSVRSIASGVAKWRTDTVVETDAGDLNAGTCLPRAEAQFSVDRPLQRVGPLVSNHLAPARWFDVSSGGPPVRLFAARHQSKTLREPSPLG